MTEDEVKLEYFNHYINKFTILREQLKEKIWRDQIDQQHIDGAIETFKKENVYYSYNWLSKHVEDYFINLGYDVSRDEDGSWIRKKY